MFWSSILVVLIITIIVVQAQQQQQSDNYTTGTTSSTSSQEPIPLLTPSDYFGGINHDTYMAWYNSVKSKYTGSAFLYDTSTTKTSALTNNSTSTNYDGVAIHWYVDEIYLHIGIVSRAQDGWIAFGLAEAGGMKGSDMMIYETSKPNILTDAHVLQDRITPTTDICQDWMYINAMNENGFLIVEGQRLLNTNDGQDYSILNDTETFIPAQRVIAAWSNTSSSMIYHGPNNRVRGALRFYGSVDESTKYQSLIQEETDGYFDLLVNDHILENVTTKYVDFCFNWDTDIVPQLLRNNISDNVNLYVVAAETILDKNGGSFVHHASITASSNPLLNASRTCLDSRAYDFFLYSWTPGTFPLVLPSNVGITLGPNNNAIQSFKLEVHYDNPLLLNNVVDNSGLRVYYKLEAPTYEAGILPMGDIFTSMEGTTLNSGTSRFDFECSSDCSTLVLQGDEESRSQGVTVIGEFFHMHNRGSAAVQYQIRNNEIIRQANVNFFDFDQAGVYAVRQQPYQILPGDSFSTTFYFESDDDAKFGPASADEMCNSVLLYYPAKRLLGVAPWLCIYNVSIGSCNASLTTSMVEITDSGDSTATSRLSTDVSDFSTGEAYLQRTFGYNTNGQCYDGTNESNVANTNGGATSSTFERAAGRASLSLFFIYALAQLIPM